MKMTVLLTNRGYDKLRNKLDKLIKEDWVEATQMIEDTRPIGVSDEFPPEYMQALDIQNRVERKIADLQKLLNDCMIFTSNMVQYDKNHNKMVGFGTKVNILDTKTNKEKTYSLVSIYESDIDNGYMSVSAPFAIEMKGLVEGDTFEFNNIEYEILKVSCID